MEVFFKNLTPEEGTTDRLLHDLNVLEENSEELFLVSQGDLAEQSKERFRRGLNRVKAACFELQARSHFSETSGETGTVNEFPYPTMGIVFGLGILLGVLVKPGRK